jgi:predicted nucleic acid-binding protein
MRIDRFIGVVDACVLAPMPVADTILRLAEEGFFIPKWSCKILEETERTLEKFGYTPEQRRRRIDSMMHAFPEALVTGYEDLVGAMKNHEGDRHVLAAAVRCKAHCIITHNQKHFQDEHLDPYDIECLPLDDFLVHQYHIDPDTFISVLIEQAKGAKRSFHDLLAGLSVHAPRLMGLIKS